MDAVTSQLVLGIIPLVVGFWLVYWINRRKFYRRNAIGSEGFSSFESSVFIRFIERMGKWIAYALIVIGILFIWSYSQMKKNKQKQKQEVITKKSLLSQ